VARGAGGVRDQGIDVGVAADDPIHDHHVRRGERRDRTVVDHERRPVGEASGRGELAGVIDPSSAEIDTGSRARPSCE